LLKFQGFSDMGLMQQRNGSLAEKVGEIMLCLVVQYWCRIRQMGQDEHIGSRCE
jgi:hypothetical protein